MQLKAKRDDHFSFKSVIDSWDKCSDETINSGTIPSLDVVCTGSPVIIMLQKVNKQVLGI